MASGGEPRAAGLRLDGRKRLVRVIGDERGSWQAAGVATRRIIFAVYDGAQSLDLCGPLECFSTASRVLEHRGHEPAYEVRVAGSRRGPVRMSSGIEIVAQRELGRIRTLDTLVVVGGRGYDAASRDATVLRAVRSAASRARRVASVCTGAFILAAADLLKGKRATTHWRWCDALAARFGDVQVLADRIFVRDGATYSSAGVTAGIDLALALIEQDLGRELALTTARLLVVYLRRPGGQAQFSASLAAQHGGGAGFSELVAWIEEHVAADLRVPVLARRVGMSPRHFARVFAQAVGASPARFVARVRLDAARRDLEGGGHSIDEVAARCGFGTVESLRRSFRRCVGITPSDYRRRFSPTTLAHLGVHR